MSLATDRIFKGIQIEYSEPLDADDARNLIAVLCLTALCDEVLTTSERLTVAEELKRRWSIGLQPEAWDTVFERIALASRQELLQAISVKFKTWSQGQVQSAIEAIVSTVTSDKSVSIAEFRLLQELGKKLGLNDEDLATLGITPGVGEVAEVLGQVVFSEGKTLRLGRSVKMDIRLPRAPIAAWQASLTLRGELLEISDASRDGLLTHKGRPIDKQIFLQPGEEVAVGRYRLRFEIEPARATIIQHGVATTLRVDQVSFSIPASGTSRPLLENIGFAARASEMVAIIGPSGCGKSTLLSVLAGIAQIDTGHVRLDDVEVRPGVEAVTRRISFVPQDELLFADLTVEESVAISARLKGLGKAGADSGSLIGEILERLGLLHVNIKNARIGDAVKRGISGGQRKRVSVAQELVGDDTDILLLDEPTSGLDPRSEASVISMLREIADCGKLVMITTHGIFDGGLRQFDKVLCLATGGRQAYFGSPDDLLKYFRVDTFIKIFDKLDNWTQSEQADTQSAKPIDTGGAAVRRARRPLGFLRQLFILTGRQLKVRLRDRAGVLLAVVFPLAVVAILRIVYRPECIEPSTLFVLGLASIWSGISFTVRDLIADFAVMRHESRSRTTVASTYASKAVVGLLASGIQALLLSFLIFPILGAENVYQFEGWRGPLLGNNVLSSVNLISPTHIFLILLAAHALGNALGLLLSALFKTADAAIFTIPLVLLPLLASAGILVAPRDLPKWLLPATDANPLFLTYRGLLASSANTCKPLASLGREAQHLSNNDCRNIISRTTKVPETRSLHSRSTPFIRTESSCSHNVYAIISDFYRDQGFNFAALEVEAGNLPGDPVDQIRLDIFQRSIWTLIVLTIALHSVAIYVAQRRVRRHTQ